MRRAADATLCRDGGDADAPYSLREPARAVVDESDLKAEEGPLSMKLTVRPVSMLHCVNASDSGASNSDR
jgi:hypothetical protein